MKSLTCSACLLLVSWCVAQDGGEDLSTLHPYDAAQKVYHGLDEISRNLSIFTYDGGYEGRQIRMQWIQEMQANIGADNLTHFQHFLNETYAHVLTEAEGATQRVLDEEQRKKDLLKLLAIDESIVFSVWSESAKNAEINQTHWFADIQRELSSEVEAYGRYHSLDEVLETRKRFDHVHGPLISKSSFTQPYKSFVKLLEANKITAATLENLRSLPDMEYKYRKLLRDNLLRTVLAHQRATSLECQELAILVDSLSTSDLEAVEQSVENGQFFGTGRTAAPIYK